MHIAFCSPVSLPLFDKDVHHEAPLPMGYTYPLTYYLAMGCLHAGHTVSVVTSANDVAQRTAWSGYEGRLRVIATPRRRTVRHSLDIYRREVNFMRAELLHLRPDLIHAQWTYEHAEAALATGLPTLVTARDAPWLVARYFRQGYRVLRALYSSLWVMPQVSYFTAVSEHIEHYFAKEPFAKPIKQWVVPNGLARKYFAPVAKRDIKNPLAPRFGAMTGWNRLKNLEALLRAFRIVKNRLPSAQLTVLGAKRGGGKKLEIRIERLGLFEGVVFPGTLSYAETLKWLETSVDILVQPTVEESFSMATLEGMAKGVPVIGGEKSGAVPWLLEHGKAGVVVNVHDATSIAAGMLRLAKNPDIYAEKAKAGFERALANFTLEKVLSNYQVIYEEVVRLADSAKPKP